MCLQPQTSPPKHGQIGHVGDVLKLSGPTDFKSQVLKIDQQLLE